MLRSNSLQEMHDHCPPEVITFMKAEVDAWEDTAPIESFKDFGGYVYALVFTSMKRISAEETIAFIDVYIIFFF